MTAQDLAQHLALLRASGEDERDRLLHELLVTLYPSPEAQDS
jgi:hypothetical protein